MRPLFQAPSYIGRKFAAAIVTRIHGELSRLGYHLAQSTVSKYMIARGSRPTQGWLTFLRNHADVIASIDMLTVPTLGLDRLYAFVVLGHGRRQILHIEVTDRPTASWLARQITEAFPWDSAPAHLVRDNDGAYGFEFQRRVKVMGIRDRPTMPRSPWQSTSADARGAFAGEEMLCRTADRINPARMS